MIDIVTALWLFVGIIIFLKIWSLFKFDCGFGINRVDDEIEETSEVIKDENINRKYSGINYDEKRDVKEIDDFRELFAENLVKNTNELIRKNNGDEERKDEVEEPMKKGVEDNVFVGKVYTG